MRTNLNLQTLALAGGLLVGCNAEETNLRTDQNSQMVDVGFSVGGDQGFGLAALSISEFTGALSCTGPNNPVTRNINSTSVSSNTVSTQLLAGATGCVIKLFSFKAGGMNFTSSSANPFSGTYAQGTTANFQSTDGSTNYLVSVSSAQLPSPLTTASTVQYSVTQGRESGGIVDVSTPNIATTNARFSINGDATPELRLISAETMAFDALNLGLTLIFECSSNIVGTSMAATCAGDALNAFKVGLGPKPATIDATTLNAILSAQGGAVSFLSTAADVEFMPLNSTRAPRGGFRITRSLSAWGIADTNALLTQRLAVVARTTPMPATSFNYTVFGTGHSWTLNNSITMPTALVSGSCTGAKYVRDTTYQGLYVAAVLCETAPTAKIKLLLAAAAAGPYREIADTAGHGQDWCELVNPNFTLPNEDDITSGGCPTCEIGSNSRVAAAPFYARNRFGENFVLTTSAPVFGTQSSPYVKCGVNVP